MSIDVRSWECPECANTTTNCQGIRVCPDCNWVANE